MSDSAAFVRAIRLRRGVQQLVRLVLNPEGTVPAFAQTFVTQVLVLVLNIATGILSARLLGPEGRGTFTAVTLWPQFMATLVLLGLQNALVFDMRLSPTCQDSVLTAGLTVGLVLSAIGSVTGAIVIPLAMSKAYSVGIVTFSIAATVILTPVNLVTMLLRLAFVVYGRVGTANTSAWATPLLYLGILLVICWTVPVTAELAACCQFSSAILVVGWMINRLARTFRLDFSGFRGRVKAVMSFMVRSAPGECLAVLAATLDRLVLVPFITASDLGFYAVAFSLSRLLMVFQAALAPVALPAMAGRQPDDAKALHDRLFRITLYAVVGISTTAFLTGDWALRLFYGAAFAPAGILFKILLLEAALNCLSFLPSQLYLTMARPGFLSLLQGMSFLMTLVGLALLVPIFGARGAALSMLLSALFRLCGMFCGLRLVLGFSLPRLTPQPEDLTRIINGFRNP